MLEWSVCYGCRCFYTAIASDPPTRTSLSRFTVNKKWLVWFETASSFFLFFWSAVAEKCLWDPLETLQKKKFVNKSCRSRPRATLQQPICGEPGHVRARWLIRRSTLEIATTTTTRSILVKRKERAIIIGKMKEKGGGGGFKGAQAAFVLACAFVLALFGRIDAALTCSVTGSVYDLDKCWAAEINATFPGARLKGCVMANHLFSASSDDDRNTRDAINNHPLYNGPTITYFVSAWTFTIISHVYPCQCWPWELIWIYMPYFPLSLSLSLLHSHFFSDCLTIMMDFSVTKINLLNGHYKPQSSP